MIKILQLSIMISYIADLSSQFLQAWVRLTQRTAWIVVIISILVMIESCWYVANNIKINTDTSDMLSAALPFRQLSKELDAVFPQFSNNIVIVIDSVIPDLTDQVALLLADRLRQHPELFGTVYDPAGDPFFRRHGLLYMALADLEEFGDQIAKAQPLLGFLCQDPNLKGLADMLMMALGKQGNTEGDAATVPILRQMAGVVESIATGQFTTPLNWGLTMQNRDNANSERRVLTIQPTLDFSTLHPAQRAIAALRAIIHALELTPAHGVLVRLTGSAALAEEELESVETGIGVANVASLLLVILLLIIGLQTIQLVVPVLFTLIIGLVVTAALALLMVDSLNLISVAFTVLFIGLGVDFGIHFSLRYQEGLKYCPDDAIGWTAANIGGPLTLAAVGTAVGFFSFLPTPYRGFAELGLISGVGMFVALITNLTVLPALLSLMPISVVHQHSSWPLTAWLAQLLARLVIRHARALTGTTVLLTVVSSVTIPAARFDFDPLNLRDPETESVKTLRDLRHDERYSPHSITILTESLTQAQELAKRLSRLPTVETVTTLFDYVPQDQGEKLHLINDIGLLLSPLLVATEQKSPPPQFMTIGQTLDALRQVLVTVRDPAAQRLQMALNKIDVYDPAILQALDTALLSTLSRRLDVLRQELLAGPVTVDDLPLALRSRMMIADGRTRIEVYPKEDLDNYEALHQFVETVRGVTPWATGALVSVYESGIAIIESFYFATVTTILVLLILLIVLLRRLREVILTLTPLLLAALLTNAITVVFSLPYNFANIIVLPLLFSIGIANGIQFVFRERLEQNPLALLNTTTPRAVVLSALTTVASFGSLGLSKHPGTASMGFLLSIAITVTVGVTLLVLPALMVMLPKRQ